ncbi:hypothetical protein [Vibrio parahaemolyticus]|uniref:hypothetical protein n=1 Tax=Vibrio parahaemolyticus TaxID=670 RepID=UPI0004E68145|nr:hypothetical protein [Vibrio parahaemolyticus]AWG83757.1 hypothetical protein Vp2S01_1417 [Vibrio parahaemolyticus]KFE96719.1 hypothetical protein HB39_01295 [Vibrio parahaemolyticus]MBE4097569.1 hypothetical protein [Vibrio parahaemolyticus]MBE4132917.1 hypothetical protein [Vibrio parahaemolyticus]MBX5337143.1 hypothetical protein [Vibrio parahaemolyticus]
MSSSMILSESLIESGRDIPLKELLYAKRVLDNYMAVAKDTSPLELLTEMKAAAKQVEYFTTDNNPCEARNVISSMIDEIDNAETFAAFKTLAGKPSQALNELIEDRAQLIRYERELLLTSGYDASRI